jgi:multiple sugar transport system ATP-binding protein
MANVKLINVSKRWGKVVGLKDLNLEIEDGEFLAILGPSGCGKSTALRIVAGLEQPTEGEICMGEDEKVVNDLSPKERNVAMVFQSYAIYPHMTVRENLEFPLKLRKYPKEEVKKRVDEAAKMLRIEDLLDRKPKELSGGERQRVALGRAVVRRPALFLMDEPLSNLDAKLRARMRGELKKLHEQLGKTTIYVTHDQVEAMTMADRIVLLKGGEVQQIGTPMELYEHPANMFVAGFIGSMNFLKGEVDEKEFVANAFEWDRSEMGEEKIEKLRGWVGKSLMMGIRPEHLTINTRKKRNAIEMEVYLVEPMGSEFLITLRAGEEEVMAKAGPDLAVKEGDRVFVTIDPEKVQFFEEGGEAIF